MLSRDPELTQAMYATGIFQDQRQRSYIAYHIHPGTNHRCRYTFGLDVYTVREEIHLRSGGFCEGCERKHYIGKEGQLHHIQGGRGKQRCWCAENLQWVCQRYHRQRHVHTRFGEGNGSTADRVQIDPSRRGEI
jgi:hypothetical protein